MPYTKARFLDDVMRYVINTDPDTLDEMALQDAIKHTDYDEFLRKIESVCRTILPKKSYVSVKSLTKDKYKNLVSRGGDLVLKKARKLAGSFGYYGDEYRG